MRLTDSDRDALAAPLSVIEGAAAELRSNGFVVIENVLPRDLVEGIREAYLPLLAQKIARRAPKRLTVEEMGADYAKRPGGLVQPFIPIGGNRDFLRWEMHLPSRAPFLDERLVANPAVLGVLERVDPTYRDCVADGLGSDVAMPGSTYQRPHQDRTIFETFVNFPLVDFVPENGPIELWPGTHQAISPGAGDVFDAGRVAHAPARVAALSAQPGLRIFARAGDVLLRDLRTIHRGTPNLSAAPRPMVSLTYGRVRAVARRAVIDACLGFAERVRERARRDEPQVPRPILLNVGNTLGRVAESKGLTDRYAHRAIPRDVWDGLAPRVRHLLRYAIVEGGANPRVDELATVGESVRLAGRFALSASTQLGLGAVEYLLGPAGLAAVSARTP